MNNSDKNSIAASLGIVASVIAIWAFITGWPDIKTTLAHLAAQPPPSPTPAIPDRNDDPQIAIQSTPSVKAPIITPTPLPSVAPSYPQAIHTPTPPTRKPEKTWDRPHIYLHIADETQRHAATELKRRLTSMGYTVVGIENAAGNEDVPTQSSELRFFTSADSVEAQRIVSELTPFFGVGGILADLPEGMPYVSHARQYEIWYTRAFH